MLDLLLGCNSFLAGAAGQTHRRFLEVGCSVLKGLALALRLELQDSLAAGIAGGESSRGGRQRHGGMDAIWQSRGCEGFY